VGSEGGFEAGREAENEARSEAERARAFLLGEMEEEESGVPGIGNVHA
jgi:hypothetical protein